MLKKINHTAKSSKHPAGNRRGEQRHTSVALSAPKPTPDCLGGTYEYHSRYLDASRVGGSTPEIYPTHGTTAVIVLPKKMHELVHVMDASIIVWRRRGSGRNGCACGGPCSFLDAAEGLLGCARRVGHSRCSWFGRILLRYTGMIFR